LQIDNDNFNSDVLLYVTMTHNLVIRHMFFVISSLFGNKIVQHFVNTEVGYRHNNYYISPGPYSGFLFGGRGWVCLVFLWIF